MEYRGPMSLNRDVGDEFALGAAKSPLALEQENKQLRARVAELERLVVCDTLTPLFNRRHFMEELDRWCWRVHRYGGEYGLLFIEVDNLKMVSASNGANASDVPLTKIAHAVSAAVRRSDLAARMGGHEFAVLLDNMPEAQLPGKAERIAKAIGKLSIDIEGKTLNPSVSVGYTALEPGVKPSELLLRAGRSMYEAKQAKGIGPLI